MHTDACSIAPEEISPTLDEWTLSDKDRESYQKAFSSILVPYASFKVGKEIGQGIHVLSVQKLVALIICCCSAVYILL